MAILVTGGAGYLGSVTVERLLARGEQIVVLDDLARGHRAALPVDIPLYQGKIGDRELVARIAREHALESCIHFAALIEVGDSVIDPAKYFENNVSCFPLQPLFTATRNKFLSRNRAGNGQRIPTVGPSCS
jgi:UDP-glucose 4-epimerase